MDKVYISKIQLENEFWKITASDRGITGVTREFSDFPTEENQISQNAARQLMEYFVHIRTDFDLPLDPPGTPFQRKVWDSLREIPYGQTVSYSWVADRIGSPKAVRAVGQAIGRNPCLVLIPCHRVLGKNGSLTGFSAGLDLKARLLSLEEE